MPSHHWASNFTITNNDIETIKGLLLEREIPMDTETLAHMLIEARLEKEVKDLKERYKDVRFYNPSDSYKEGQRVVFPALNHAEALIVGVREGNNPDYEDFNVIAVEFEDTEQNGRQREFAADLKVPHKLSGDDSFVGNPIASLDDVTAETVLEAAGDKIIEQLENRLVEDGELISVAQTWFPRDLMIGINDGHLNLAEAVLDIAGGGPLSTEDIIEQIGGVANVPMELQVFSLNYTMNEDDRFDEVGPAGQVLWYLTSGEPDEVQRTPALLRYSPIDYDEDLVSPEMHELEAEIDDELSDLDISDMPQPLSDDAVTLTLIYPHRRVGTLPLNVRTEHIFPSARRTPRVCVTLVDGQDGEEYRGWVVRKDRYVYGLQGMYTKHNIPVGAFVTLRISDEPGKIIVDFNAYRPRTEYVRMLIPTASNMTFENNTRSIGADYDDLMILGVDDLDSLDELYETVQQQQRSLSSILKMLIPELGRLTPQGAVHAKTLYSTVNTIKRCPPGPILATLVAHPDFTNVGGHYWTLSDS